MSLSALSLRYKFILTVSIIVAIPMWLLSYFIYQKSKSQLLMENEKKALTLVQIKVNQIDRFFSEKGEIVKVFQKNPFLKEWLEHARRKFDRSRDQRYQKLVKFANDIVTSDGSLKSVFWASEKTQGYYDFSNYIHEDDYYIRNRPWYQEARKVNHFYWTSPNIDLKDNKLTISAMAPIYNGNEFLGFCGIDLLLTDVSDIINKIRYENVGFAFLIDQGGNILSYPEKELIGKNITGPDTNFKKADVFLGQVSSRLLNQKTGMISIRYDNEPYYLAFAPIKSTGWKIALIFPESLITSPLTALKYKVLWSIIISTLLAGAIIFVASRRLIKPITQIGKNLELIAQGKGDLSFRLPVTSEDELGFLAKNFNAFSGHLNFMISKIKSHLIVFKDKTAHLVKNAQENLSSSRQEKELIENTGQSVSQMVVSMSQINDASRKQSESLFETSKALQEINQSIQNTLEQEQTMLGHIESTSAAIEEMTVSIDGVSQMAEKLNSLAGSANHQTSDGQSQIQSLMGEIESIEKGVIESSEIITNLHSSTTRISEITRVIDEIADQTNLLALNAAI